MMCSQVDRKQLPADWRKRLRLIQAKAAELPAPDQVLMLVAFAEERSGPARCQRAVSHTIDLPSGQHKGNMPVVSHC
jgi:hypothetical protein